MIQPLADFAQTTLNRALRLDPELQHILKPLLGKSAAWRVKPGPDRVFMIAFESDGIVFVDP
ncbi:MAG TPA: hypothetical protein EYP90_12260, partial [Chromatiaceae bacterium]|nr:hypothetical protein [Chromatiaceae bacterium]